MPCQPNSPCPILPIDRPPLTYKARSLEKALDDLPNESPWRTTLDGLHKQIADALDPGA